eukprot:CAMPEP_0206266788 /NCGR_PEP_ID=MMETSP0047_2-20121206/30786_1 /ASSEMBLY_ACC=CAM_ASM_000192 /TAXON_ID=195065 /ORGANISM="Chroomonas mesostigmatica_cf, Strain CCMP1168" /LENGTH=721 /DNA_ID=CAMNT_0053694915 /DNA_START=12 /DNA_END=2177 /DNA_ORIENTATION=+
MEDYSGSSNSVSVLSTGLLLPDAVSRICDEGQALIWNNELICYEVIDGALFEKRFDELRRKRDRDDGSNGRPFSRMHKYYKLLSGERWAKTGARFQPKDAKLFRTNSTNKPMPSVIPSAPIGEEYIQAMPVHDILQATGKRARIDEDGSMAVNGIGMQHEAPIYSQMQSGDAMQTTSSAHVSAENITVRLARRSNVPYVGDTFEVSLQHFLDMVDASTQFDNAKQARSAVEVKMSPGSSSPETQNLQSSDEEPLTSDTGESGASSPDGECLTTECPDKNGDTGMEVFSAFDGLFDQGPGMENGPAWQLWDENSKGDQAYFFQRNPSAQPFFNGAIVALREGVLCPVDSYDTAEMFLVVSDKNAKWKGEPHPSPEQEKHGHWCAYLGQVPLHTKSAVRAGQYLGPCEDGSGYARVVELGEGPIVGIALSETSAEGGVVKTMVSVGLNALREGQGGAVVKRLDRLADTIADARREARGARDLAETAVLKAEAVVVDLNGLQKRVGKMEDTLYDNKMDASRALSQPLRIISRRRYLWTCFCGLFSITMSEEDSIEDAKEEDDSQHFDIGRALFSERLYDILLTLSAVTACLVTMAASQQCHNFTGWVWAQAEFWSNTVTLVYPLLPMYRLGRSASKMCAGDNRAAAVAFLRSQASRFAGLAMVYGIWICSYVSIWQKTEGHHTPPLFFWLCFVTVAKALWAYAFKRSPSYLMRRNHRLKKLMEA